LFVGPVIVGSCGALLRSQPVEMSSIEPVHAGPAIEPVAYIRGHALLARDVDESRNEAVVAVTVD
jgi:hypothetical protein